MNSMVVDENERRISPVCHRSNCKGNRPGLLLFQFAPCVVCSLVMAVSPLKRPNVADKGYPSNIFFFKMGLKRWRHRSSINSPDNFLLNLVR